MAMETTTLNNTRSKNVATDRAVRVCNENIRKTLDLARELTILADEGEAASKDDGCAVLYGVVRDCAYKMRAQAKKEKMSHQASGLWF
ncbi:MAG: hypothetical protein QGH15_05445 [Kiritimatiellia bacterium]|jgi:hypothetical protein|nr:hypothetical protein [Kiritimatiellia bacterium]